MLVTPPRQTVSLFGAAVLFLFSMFLLFCVCSLSGTARFFPGRFVNVLRLLDMPRSCLLIGRGVRNASVFSRFAVDARGHRKLYPYDASLAEKKEPTENYSNDYPPPPKHPLEHDADPWLLVRRE